ncbi:MAG: hypothetical protein ACRDUB_23745, partial [Mycobacterium sp.]
MKQVLSYAGLAVTTQPANTVGVIGGNATFGPITYTSQFPITPVLQWQIQTGGVNSDWQVLTETAGYYEGCATATLSVKAIDNFLANFSSLNFRCALFYPGAAAIYTNTVTLTVGKFVSWSPMLYAFGGAQTGANATAGNRVILQTAGPSGTGFTATSFLWSRISGSASFICSNTAIANPAWTYTAVPAGLTMSVWKCRLSDGVTTIDTDPVTLIVLGVPASAASPATFQTSPVSSSDGSALRAQGGALFIGPWTIAAQNNLRRVGTPAVTINSPTAISTAFTLPGGTLPASAVVVYAFAQVRN